MKIKVLASGSKGNSTYLETDNTKLLIDMGINYITVKKELDEIQVDLKEIDGVLITHTHTDHIKGLASFIKKTNSKVFVTLELARQLVEIIPKENIFLLQDKTLIKSVEVELLHTSHDAVGSVGYKIKTKDKSLVYITDTGYINEKYFKLLSNANIYILESNHDEEMLMNGPYPYYLKQRVLGDEGHLSNKMAGQYLSTMIGDKTKYVVLAHLSEKNNTEELALETVKKYLKESHKEREIIIAKQHESLDVIEV